MDLMFRRHLMRGSPLNASPVTSNSNLSNLWNNRFFGNFCLSYTKTCFQRSLKCSRSTCTGRNLNNPFLFKHSAEMRKPQTVERAIVTARFVELETTSLLPYCPTVENWRENTD